LRRVLRPREAVRETEYALAAAGVPDPRTDAELLVAHVLGGARSALYVAEGPLGEQERRRLRSLSERRRRREPLQHVLGEWGFRRLTLAVDGRALVPRPETEVVVERCLVLLTGVPAPRVLDVGTGSGAIALALADEHPGVRVVGVDASAEALALAAENARRTGLADRVELLRADALVAGDGLRLAKDAEGAFDLVVSNPPYVRADELAGLQPEVRDHEPREALVGSGVTEAVARRARALLRPGGRLVLEVGDGQAPRVAALLRSLAFDEIAVTPDLAGVDRVVDARWDAAGGPAR
jgi:release factor glutamine methyltransferase